MTIGRDHVPQPIAEDGSHPVPGTSPGAPDSIQALVGSSDVPLAAVDLPSGRFLAVNPQLASAVGSSSDALTGSSSLDWLSVDDRPAARLGFQALADGNLTGYQAVRRLASREDPDQAFSIWVSASPVQLRVLGIRRAAGRSYCRNHDY